MVVFASLTCKCVRTHTLTHTHTHTCTDRLDLRQSSLIQGPSRGHTPFGFPYQPVPPELKEQRRILEEFKNVPFSQWTLQAIIAWMEAGIGR